MVGGGGVWKNRKRWKSVRDTRNFWEEKNEKREKYE